MLFSNIEMNLWNVEVITDNYKYIKFYNILDLNLDFSSRKKYIQFTYLDTYSQGLFNYDLVDELKYVLLWFGQNNETEISGYSCLVKPNSYNIKMKIDDKPNAILKHDISIDLKKVEKINNKKNFILSKKIDFHLGNSYK